MENQALLKILEERHKHMKRADELEKTLYSILSSFYSMGGPLNDNRLQFNTQQMKFLFEIAQEIKEVVH